MRTNRFFMAGVIFLLFLPSLKAQTKEWTLSECIDYALDENIQVRKAAVSENVGEINLQQALDNRWPDLIASAGENLGTGSDGGSSRTSFSVSSGVTLFSGFQVKNEIKKAELSYKGLQYNTDEMKESVSLSIMNAYLQVLYAEEQVSNSRNQADATREELALARERYDLGAIANSDYLQVKTQLASEELALAEAMSSLEMCRVTLMQLMELPVGEPFAIARPDIDSIISTTKVADASSVYDEALRVKPQIKSAEINSKGAEIDLSIARSGYLPSLSLSAGLNTSFTEATAMGSQLKDNFSTSTGLSLSIPVFRNNQNRSSVARAKAAITTAELDELNTKNQLRKEIEQACLDASSAGLSYHAALNQHEASLESYNVAEEKFKLGAMNSVDFLIQKTNLTSAESNLLQAKFELVYSYKIIDFYMGVPLSF